MSDAAEFIDAALRYEASPYSMGVNGSDQLEHYGSSIGAIRGTIRDAARRYIGLTHDEITALSSELWAVPVFERRRAAIVLLQSNSALLVHTDLTRLEGFIRSAGSTALVDALIDEVLRPLLKGLDAGARAKAEVVLSRWASDPDAELQRASRMVGPPRLRVTRPGAQGVGRLGAG